jgi:uncharacterized LabA/DUF88 family protein
MRLAIFIDAGYLIGILRDELGGLWLDYTLFPKHIAETVMPNIDVLRTYYYHCLPYQSNPPTQEEALRFGKQQKFYEFLEDLPSFQVRLGRLEKRGPDANGKHYFEQKRVDVLLSIDLVELSAMRQITHAAIIAGDSDFCPAVEIAKKNGVSVWLFHGNTPHKDLRRAADQRIRVDSAFCDPVKQSQLNQSP